MIMMILILPIIVNSFTINENRIINLSEKPLKHSKYIFFKSNDIPNSFNILNTSSNLKYTNNTSTNTDIDLRLPKNYNGKKIITSRLFSVVKLNQSYTKEIELYEDNSIKDIFDNVANVLKITNDNFNILDINLMYPLLLKDVLFSVQIKDEFLFPLHKFVLGYNFNVKGINLYKFSMNNLKKFQQTILMDISPLQVFTFHIEFSLESFILIKDSNSCFIHKIKFINKIFEILQSDKITLKNDFLSFRIIDYNYLNGYHIIGIEKYGVFIYDSKGQSFKNLTSFEIGNHQQQINLRKMVIDKKKLYILVKSYGIISYSLENFELKCKTVLIHPFIQEMNIQNDNLHVIFEKNDQGDEFYLNAVYNNDELFLKKVILLEMNENFSIDQSTIINDFLILHERSTQSLIAISNKIYSHKNNSVFRMPFYKLNVNQSFKNMFLMSYGENLSGLGLRLSNDNIVIIKKVSIDHQTLKLKFYKSGLFTLKCMSVIDEGSKNYSTIIINASYNVSLTETNYKYLEIYLIIVSLFFILFVIWMIIKGISEKTKIITKEEKPLEDYNPISKSEI